MKNVFGFIIAVILTGTSLCASAQNEAADDAVMDSIDVSMLPVVSPYYFQHQFLSVIAPTIVERDGFLLETPEVLNEYTPIGNGFMSPFKNEDIKIEVIDDGGQKVYVWRFPESEYLREALYMAFFPIDGHYEAFAISIGRGVDWEISMSTASYRSTFGRVKKPESARECFELLKDRGAFTGDITPGEFFQEGYEGPEYRPK